MAKSPENMTPEERLKRIKSLERKVWDLEHRLARAEREREGTYEWAHSAFTENRRLTDRLRELIERIPSIIQPDIDRAVSLGRCEPCGETVDGTSNDHLAKCHPDETFSVFVDPQSGTWTILGRDGRTD